MNVVEAEKELKNKLNKLEEEKKLAIEEDPYKDTARVNDNAASDTDAAEEEGHLRSEAVVSTVVESIEKTKRALEKIKEETWGKCDDCGKEIEEKRLEIDSATLVCLDCAQKNE